jgi:ATP-dependent RNA helicase RhlB
LPNELNSGADSASKTNKKYTNNRSHHGRRRSRSREDRQESSEWDISQFDVPPQKGKIRFHDLDLQDNVMHAIADLGFQYCSPIQAQSLPHTLQGHDVLGKGQTGTGKTAAFLLTIIDDIQKNPIEDERCAGEPRALIIAPTRELVMQIADDAHALTKYTDIKVHTLVGGMDYGKQKQRMDSMMCDILVATPGRLLDFSSRRDVYLDQIEVLVIDEADRMLDMGFIPQVRNIVRLAPKREERQTLLFSATFTPEVMSLSEQWTYKTIQIEVASEGSAADSVDQKVYITEAREKFALLKSIVTQDSVESVIVFANRRDQCRRLQERLQRGGLRVGLLSGEVAQNKRVKTLDDFKSGRTKVLVATDVAGRGIHVDGISHVINYTLPEEAEDYVHRIGRTGRAGKTGISISFACEDDAFLLEPIQELLGEKLKCELPPEELLKD